MREQQTGSQWPRQVWGGIKLLIKEQKGEIKSSNGKCKTSTQKKIISLLNHCVEWRRIWFESMVHDEVNSWLIASLILFFYSYTRQVYESIALTVGHWEHDELKTMHSVWKLSKKM